MTVPQHGHSRPGSAHSVAFRITSTSMTCAHREPAAAAPSRAALQLRHSAGGPASFTSSGSGSRARPFPWCPGCPPRLRSLRRSRSDSCRRRPALRRSVAPMLSFDVGVPESVLSWPSRRSSSATRSSSRRYRSSAASSSARSTAFSASFASITARSRASSSRCSPAPADGSGTSDTNPDHAHPQLQIQAPRTPCHADLTLTP